MQSKIDKDYESVRYCLILSQTFHRINSKNVKITLQNEIMSDHIWNDLLFWEEILKCIHIYINYII